MERGYIKIKENKTNQWIVEAKLVNCTLWLSKHEMANLFNVFVNSIFVILLIDSYLHCCH
jgi:hypothetical protein